MGPLVAGDQRVLVHVPLKDGPHAGIGGVGRLPHPTDPPPPGIYLIIRRNL